MSGYPRDRRLRESTQRSVLPPKRRRSRQVENFVRSYVENSRGSPSLQLLLVDHNLGRAINLFSAMHFSSARKSRNNLGIGPYIRRLVAFLPGHPLYSAIGTYRHILRYRSCVIHPRKYFVRSILLSCNGEKCRKNS